MKAKKKGNYLGLQASSIAIDNYDLVYVTEDGNHRVSIFSNTGHFHKSFGKEGQSEGDFYGPLELQLIRMEFNVYVSDHDNDRINGGILVVSLVVFV